MSSPVSQITDHTRRIKADQLSLLRQDPATQALIAVFGDEIQLAETFFYSVLTDRLLDIAEGVNLDRIGRMVGASRLGRTDEEYRRIIKVTIRALNSQGGVEDVLWVATNALRVVVRYVQEGKAFFRLEAQTDDDFEPAFMAEALRLIGIAAPGGVAWALVIGDETDGARYDSSRFDDGEYGAVKGGDYQ